MAPWKSVACASCVKQVWRSEEELTEEAAASVTCGACRAGRVLRARCEICLEDGVALLPGAARAPPGAAGAAWPCHRFCGGCWEMHVRTGVAGGRLEITCPGVGCAFALKDKDVKRLAPSSFAAFLEAKYRCYVDRLREVFLAGDAFGEWARSHTQSCPRCHVLVERSEGCNHMTCRCGSEFCYKCGCTQVDDCNCAYAEGPALLAGQLELLAPLLGEVDARDRAARALQAAARRRAGAAGVGVGCVDNATARVAV